MEIVWIPVQLIFCTNKWQYLGSKYTNIAWYVSGRGEEHCPWCPLAHLTTCSLLADLTEQFYCVHFVSFRIIQQPESFLILSSVITITHYYLKVKACIYHSIFLSVIYCLLNCASILRIRTF